MEKAEQKITIQDIADRAGVAKSTVSRYLNNGYISAEKAAVIDKVIQQTGYRENFFAKRLKTKHSRLIGIVMPRFDSYSAGKLLTGFNAALEQNGYQALILVSDLRSEKEIANIRRLMGQGVDGIIVQSVGITDEHLKLAAEAPVPLIFTGQSHPDVFYVKVNDYRAGRLMGEYIAKLGHDKAVYLGVSSRDVAVGQKRRQGFEEGFAAHNPHGSMAFVETDFSFDKAYEQGAAVMKHNPTAVVCATDNIALGLLRYLHENNIKVPQDLSLAGFGGYPFGSVAYPSLTSLAFDYEYLGAKTAQKLLTMLKGKKVKSEFDDHMIFITRESTRALR